MRGKIIKGVGGLYYVCPAEGNEEDIYECRAKGVFRRDGRKPLTGDEVELDVLDIRKKLGNIRELLPRHSELIRPAVANADQALVIFAVTAPAPNFNLLDRFLIRMGQQGLDTVICFNKQDLDGPGKEHMKIYSSCGYRVLGVSALYGQGLEELRSLLAGKTTVTAGPSGVGKSSIVNCLQTETVMEIGAVSAKIERGKHTTRHSQLIKIGADTFVFDTPGFSSLDLFDLKKEELSGYYPEFGKYEAFCRFGGCAHLEEPDCGVKEALEKGMVSSVRYENYKLLYEELRQQEKRFPGGSMKVSRG